MDSDIAWSMGRCRKGKVQSPRTERYYVDSKRMLNLEHHVRSVKSQLCLLQRLLYSFF